MMPAESVTPNESKDFFISYTHKDRAWAEWIAWQLEGEGYKTVLQAWDFVPGSNFVLEMDHGLKQSAILLAVISRHYLNSNFTPTEWAQAFRRDSRSVARSLIPVKVSEVDTDGLLSQLVYIDLVGKPEKEARSELLSKLQKGRMKPISAPRFPGNLSKPNFPLNESLRTRVQFTIVLAGTIEIADKAVVEAILERLRTISDDTSLTLQRIRTVPIVLSLECSREGFLRLSRLFDKGDLYEVHEFRIEGIQLVKSTSEVASTEPVATYSNRPGQTPPGEKEPPASKLNVLIVGRLAERLWSSLEVVGKTFRALDTSEALRILGREMINLMLIDLPSAKLEAVVFCRSVRSTLGLNSVGIFLVAESEDLESAAILIDAGADRLVAASEHQRALGHYIKAWFQLKQMTEAMDGSEDLLFSLAKSVEDRGPGLYRHCERVATMASALGMALNLPLDNIQSLQRCGYLHDIGNIGIPDRILLKSSTLDQEEWRVMKSHAERGERICACMKSLSLVLPIVRSHHERWDGSGYPDALRGQEIPLLTRILQIADIYDALRCDRPWRPAFSHEDALSIIREETTRGWRDPYLVSMFLDLAPIFKSWNRGSSSYAFGTPVKDDTPYLQESLRLWRKGKKTSSGC